MGVYLTSNNEISIDMIPLALWILDFTEHDQTLSEVPMAINLPDSHEIAHRLNLVRVVDVNKAAVKLYGATSKKELRVSLAKVIPPDSYRYIMIESSKPRNGSIPYTLDTYNYNVAGRQFEVRLIIQGYKGNDRNLVLITVLPVSDIQAMDDRLRMLSRLPEANPDMVIIMDCEAQVRYLNRKAKLWLYERKLYKYEDILQLLPEEYRVRECGTCDRESERQLTFDHENNRYLMKIRPLGGENRCMVVISDITEQTRLKEERELFSEAIQSVDQPVIITDHHGIILYVNRAFERLYGYSADEIKGLTPKVFNPGRRTYLDLGYTNEGYDALFSGLWTSVLNEATPRWEGELVNKTKDGRLVQVRLLIAGVKCDRGLISHFIAMPVDITDERRNAEVTRLQCYRTIAAVAEMRDNETGHHMLRVGAYARILASAIGMNAKYSSDIETFAPLHDIGKVGITDEILLAPRKLSEREFTVMKNHTILGYQILAGKDGMEMAAEICYAHHERWDGRGYPQGLEGDDIPLSARIAAIADVYDALRSKRPYKQEWSHEDALREIVNSAGTQFDPAMVGAFERVESEFHAIFSDPRYMDRQ